MIDLPPPPPGFALPALPPATIARDVAALLATALLGVVFALALVCLEVIV